MDASFLRGRGFLARNDQTPGFSATVAARSTYFPIAACRLASPPASFASVLPCLLLLHRRRLRHLPPAEVG